MLLYSYFREEVEMGVDISKIIRSQAISFKDLSGKVIAIDAFNSLYQFLSIIRLPDGNPLRNRDGEVTSHLSGLFYRCVNFLEAGIKPIYVFDGESPQLKQETIRQRASARAEAETAWQEALAEGDMRRAWSKATRASRLTGMMIDDSKRLLNYLGIPYIQAPSEGEAEASYLVHKGFAYAAASQDYDSLLLGCRRLIRNLAVSGKRRIPKTNRFNQIEPEEIILDDVLRDNEITRDQLVDIAILIGTDYNPGIKGIGPKKALNLILKYQDIEHAIDEGPIDQIDNLEELRQLFLNPDVIDPPEMSWEVADRTATIGFMCDQNGFSVDRISSAFDRIPRPEKTPASTSLDMWLE